MEELEYTLKPMRTPSKELIPYYESLFERNQTKFIRRSALDPEHLGSEFELDGKNLKLMGSIDALLMLVRDENNKFYMLESSIITKKILEK